MSTLLCHCTPLPPAQNGIADYAYRVIGAMSNRYRSVAVCEDAFAQSPNGVEVYDPEQVFRLSSRDTCFIHQLGNNWDHTFVLKLAIANPGILVLHDQKLLYLYESLGLPEDDLFARMAQCNPMLTGSRASRFAFGGEDFRSDHLLFDMLPEVVSASRAVVVHTEYAKRVIARHLGRTADEKTYVIPHFAIETMQETRVAARARLGLEPDWFVILTSGFATVPKRFDLIVPAIDALAREHRKIVWVQAGAVRAHEFDLVALINRYPPVAPIARITGFIDEQDLDGYINAADVLVNLRFPSVGESSGSLSRALAAGICCVVTDTAGYRELPDDVVVKLSPLDGPHQLYVALSALLKQPHLRERFAENARHYALRRLSLEQYCNRLANIVDRVMAGSSSAAADCQVMTSRAALQSIAECRRLPIGMRFTARLGPVSPEDVSSAVSNALLPEGIKIDSVDVDVSGDEASDVYLIVEGQHMGPNWTPC